MSSNVLRKGLEEVVISRSGSGQQITYRAAGDRQMLVEYGEERFDLNLNFTVQAVLSRIADSGTLSAVECTPGFRSIVVSYDSASQSRKSLIDALDAIHDSLPPIDELVLESRVIHLPLTVDDAASRAAVQRYVETIRSDAPYTQGGSNIPFVLEQNGLGSVEDLARVLTESQLWVGFIGFFPGLPFMFPLDPSSVISVPKYNPTRTWTPEGAVGLGGPCISIYPVESPGGYHLLGRTLPVYDIQQRNAVFETDPILLRAGDRVQFHLVSEDELEATRAAVHNGKYEYVIEDGVFRVGDHPAILPEADDADESKPLAHGSSKERG